MNIAVLDPPGWQEVGVAPGATRTVRLYIYNGVNHFENVIEVLG